MSPRVYAGTTGARTSATLTALPVAMGHGRLSARRLPWAFRGGTYRQVFYVADVNASGPAINGELHVDLDEADFLAVFPLAGTGRARLIGTVRDDRADHAETLRFEDVAHRAIDHLKVEIATVNWFSTYRVHHRVAQRFRVGRAFLLGDAAHIHSPAGGQGMNTGIGDAINLAWKLAAVLAGRAPDDLSDSYETERKRFAESAGSDNRSRLQLRDGAGPAGRHRADPARAARASRRPCPSNAVREFLFRTVSQDLPQLSRDVAEFRRGRRRSRRRQAALDWTRRRRQFRNAHKRGLAGARLRLGFTCLPRSLLVTRAAASRLRLAAPI